MISFSPRILSRVLLPLLTLGAVTCVAPAVATAQDTFFTLPDHIETNDDHAIIEFMAPYGSRERDIFLLAVPSSESLNVTVESLSMRKVGGVEAIQVDSSANPAHARIEGDFRNNVAVEPFGAFRKVNAARVRVDRTRLLSLDMAQHEVVAYRLRISYAPPAGNSDSATDSAITAGPYRTFLNAALTDPNAIERFAGADSPSPHPGPTDWQPRPQLSPDFPWLRLAIAEDGLYSIDGRWLSEGGVDVTSVRPEELSLFSRGEVVPAEIVGPVDAGFQGGQRLIFHAQGSSSRETTERIYYLGRTETPSPRFAAGEPVGDDAPILNHYVRDRLIREENIFQTRFGLFLSIRSMQWLWAELNGATPWETMFDLPGFSPTGEETTTGTLTLYFQEPARVTGLNATVSVGNTSVGSAVVGGTSNTVPLAVPISMLRERNNRLQVKVETKEPQPTGVYIESLELAYRGTIDNTDGEHELFASKYEALATGPHRVLANRFRAQRLFAIDVTDPEQPVRLPISSRGMNVLVGAHLRPESRVLLVEDGAIRRAPAGTALEWNDWTARDHSADILIIHHPLFEEAATTLADDLRGAGAEVLSIDTHSVYTAFNHGELSSDAIRNFLATAVNEWTGRRPHSAILIGDANGDGRGVARNSVPNFLPAPLSGADNARDENLFAADAVYTWLVGADEVADILVGRLSSSTPEEALATVRNIIAYREQENEAHEWGNRVMAIADTGDFSIPLNKALLAGLAPSHEALRVYADDFPWEDNYYLPEHLLGRAQDSKVSPLMTAAIEDNFNGGVAIAAFLGHGAPNLWSNQRFWFGGGTPNSDILRLQRNGKFSYIASFTCNNAVIDYPLKPWNICIAEDFMRHEGKGAVSAFMPSGPGYVSNHTFLAEGFFRAWSQLGIREHGVIGELARLNQQARNRVDEHSRMFIFLGDPTLRMPAFESNADTSKPTVAIASINDLSTTTSLTLKQFNLVLENEGVCDAVVGVTAKAGPASTVSDDVVVPARGKSNVVLELDVEQPGVYTADFIGGSSSKVHHFAVTSEQGRLEAMDSSVAVVKAPSRTGKPQIVLDVVNAANHAKAGRVTFAITTADGKNLGGERRVQTLPPGTSARVTHELDIRGELTEPIEVGVAIHGGEEGAPAHSTFHRTIAPEDLPDLALVEEALRIVPETPTDGFTVFVEGLVRNQSTTSASEEAVIALFANDDFASPLRDMTRKAPLTIPPLQPGEEAPFRLRWDPHDNAGEQRIAVVVDPDDLMLEPNKANNLGTKPLRVRTKWELETGEISVQQTSQTTFVLSAEVKNHGETDAQRVTVNFYRTGQQSDDTKIGEILLERVPAGETIHAEFPWIPTEEQRTQAASDFAPSFTLALKGSQQRVSSVAASP